MAGFVEAHVAIAQPSRVVGLGYSNGANILASVIFARPALFDAGGADAPADPLDAGAGAGDDAGADHRRRARPDLPARGRPGRSRPGSATQGARSTIHWHPGGHEIDRSEITAIARFLR